MKPRLAILGATGAVGTLLCRLLAERNFPFESIRFFGSPSGGEGRRIDFRGRSLPVEPLVRDRIRKIDLAIASTPDEVAAECAPWIVDQGGVMVDESAAHRMHSHVPLVIPEINPQAIEHHQGIIASPNCSTTQLAICLKPLHDHCGIERAVVSTYQAASGAGQAALQELIDGTRAKLDHQDFSHHQFESPLPLNLWPKIGRMMPDDSTSEETKMVLETRKILADEALRMCVTCVRVPVLNCHSESVVIETKQPVTPQQARELFEQSAGISILDDPAELQLPTPQGSNDHDDVFVGRIRRDLSVENGLAFWCVSDNLRKGAATNAVQIAELLVEGQRL